MSGTLRTWPLRICGSAGRFGQDGVVVTTTSPGSTSACITSISAFMADAETITLLGREAGAVQPVHVVGERRPQLVDAGIGLIERVAGGERPLPRHRR